MAQNIIYNYKNNNNNTILVIKLMSLICTISYTPYFMIVILVM